MYIYVLSLAMITMHPIQKKEIMYNAQFLTVSWLTYFVRIDNMNVGRGFSSMRNI